uniref:Uncharacterized protein n=1 Tax=Candidatus Kentrum sp. TC TaxID=2126339 RepID=A0A450Y853_9GAMM|nr:MAG: hypothetical protein BECKTC1821E_GA0114239_100169 [Candidatus Kentron sp. TC]
MRNVHDAVEGCLTTDMNTIEPDDTDPWRTDEHSAPVAEMASRPRNR